MLKKLRFFWRRDERGVVAVEFALLAIPFFTLLIGTVEMAMYFAAGVVLEGSAHDAARMIRTGQVQEAEDPETAFQEELCDRAGALLECDNIQYEVIRADANTFASAEDYEPQFDEDGNLIPEDFSTGNSNDVVMVRVLYRYSFMTPWIGEMVTGDVNGGSRVHMASVVIKAEPYNYGEE